LWCTHSISNTSTTCSTTTTTTSTLLKLDVVRWERAMRRDCPPRNIQAATPNIADSAAQRDAVVSSEAEVAIVLGIIVKKSNRDLYRNPPSSIIGGGHQQAVVGTDIRTWKHRVV
jgi:hypothetical protein